jgi:intracellular septation protein
MKQFLDFIPILLFFAAYKLYKLYHAAAGLSPEMLDQGAMLFSTAVLMVSTVVQMAIVYKMDGHLQTMHKVTLGLVLGFGALTLAFHDIRFIKIKPTVLYTFMALTLGIALWIYKKNFLKMMLGSQLNLPEGVWRNLTVAWVSYALFMATLNAYVAYAFTTEQWVNFKVWGYVFPVAFILAQGLYIAKYLQLPDDDGNESKP